MKKYEDEISNLYNILSDLKSPEDCRLLLEDLCTNKEIIQMALRIKAAKLLLEGNTYQQVTEKCDISSATLSRVSRCVQYGDGYSKFLKT